MSAEVCNTVQLDNGYRVTFIYHSGYMVETPQATYVFDYYRGALPKVRRDKPLYVFSSHRHNDHFNFDILSWNSGYHVTYILSKDIGKKYKKKYFLEKKGISEKLYDSLVFLGANQVWEDEYIRVCTVESTDVGVAFLVKSKADGRLVYHAGDLNWWTWEGESEEEYRKMTTRFKACVMQLKQLVYEEEKQEIDIAFLPLDPRQQERYALGFDYYMRKLNISTVFPMHAFGDYSVIVKFLKDEVSASYRHKIVNICGETGRQVKIPNQLLVQKIQELANCNRKRKLGIIGGLGPMATVYFMELLVKMTDAKRDQEHMDIVLQHCPSIADRTGFLLDINQDSPVPAMIEAGQALIREGAEEIAIPCVTAHCFQRELEEAMDRPVVDAVGETAAYLGARGYRQVGIMATDGVVRNHLFTDALGAQGIRCVYPSEMAQAAVMTIIYEEIKAGKPANMDKFRAVSRELFENGAEVILLGCTELSLIKRDNQLEKGYLDVLDVLAKTCVERCGKLRAGYEKLET